MDRCLLLLLIFFATITSGHAAPQIQVEQLSYDFGEVLQGEKVDYTFRFTNSGDEVLEVGNVRSSCGCTAALLSAQRIAPGDMGELQVTFDSTRFRGAISKVVSFDSNDPQKQQVSFSMIGQVKAELLIQPERVNWGAVSRGELLESQVVIKNLGSQVINLQPPQSTNPAVNAELSALNISPGEQVELRLSTQLAEDKTRLGGYVVIATDYAKHPQLRVSVSARLAK